MYGGAAWETQTPCHAHSISLSTVLTVRSSSGKSCLSSHTRLVSPGWGVLIRMQSNLTRIWLIIFFLQDQTRQTFRWDIFKTKSLKCNFESKRGSFVRWLWYEAWLLLAPNCNWKCWAGPIAGWPQHPAVSQVWLSGAGAGRHVSPAEGGMWYRRYSHSRMPGYV